MPWTLLQLLVVTESVPRTDRPLTKGASSDPTLSAPRQGRAPLLVNRRREKQKEEARLTVGQRPAPAPQGQLGRAGCPEARLDPAPGSGGCLRPRPGRSPAHRGRAPASPRPVHRWSSGCFPQQERALQTSLCAGRGRLPEPQKEPAPQTAEEVSLGILQTPPVKGSRVESSLYYKHRIRGGQGGRRWAPHTCRGPGAVAGGLRWPAGASPASP